MALEWDEAKRSKRLAERGLDFADVDTVDWTLALTAEDTRIAYAERRFVTVAPIKGRLCVIAWCWRGAAMRVISLRKANDRESKRYAEAIRLPCGRGQGVGSRLFRTRQARAPVVAGSRKKASCQSHARPRGRRTAASPRECKRVRQQRLTRKARSLAWSPVSRLTPPRPPPCPTHTAYAASAPPAPDRPRRSAPRT